MKEELNRELEQLQRQYHDLNEKMILGTIDPIEFHNLIQLNEERQRVIYNQLEEIEQQEQQIPITSQNLKHKIKL
ncbi:MAG: hypothetical protein MJZ32_06185 [Bacteroidaceae bacterium]|nr:hypothetical protein [Bacteroidaceae bacterium]